jgi:DNA-binding transcriptional LysR family regulator
MTLRRHDLNLLVILEALLRHGSTSGAARELHLSQPAVSQALQRARDMLGDPLLLRTGRAMQPTARGIALRASLPDLLGRVADVLASPDFRPDLSNRTFTIASGDLAENTLLPRALASASKAAPGCRFEVIPVRHDYGDEVPDLLLMGAAPPHGPWLSRELFSDRFVFLARKGHPALRGRLTLDAFCALSHVLVSPRGGGFSGPVDGALEAIGRRRSVTMSLPRFATLPRLLAKSELVAAAPQRFANLAFVKALCESRKLPFEVPPFTMKLVWHRSRDADPAQRWLRQHVIEAIPAGPPMS